MKKVIGVLSVSLWAAALVFSPAPADAFWGKYPTAVNYFSCSTFQSTSRLVCNDPEGGSPTYFYGKMKNTIPLSQCAGSCNGTESLLVQADPGNGRKTSTPELTKMCTSGYLLELAPCSSC